MSLYRSIFYVFDSDAGKSLRIFQGGITYDNFGKCGTETFYNLHVMCFMHKIMVSSYIPFILVHAQIHQPFNSIFVCILRYRELWNFRIELKISMPHPSRRIYYLIFRNTSISMDSTLKLFPFKLDVYSCPLPRTCVM